MSSIHKNEEADYSKNIDTLISNNAAPNEGLLGMAGPYSNAGNTPNQNEILNNMMNQPPHDMMDRPPVPGTPEWDQAQERYQQGPQGQAMEAWRAERARQMRPFPQKIWQDRIQPGIQNIGDAVRSWWNNRGQEPEFLGNAPMDKVNQQLGEPPTY